MCAFLDRNENSWVLDKLRAQVKAEQDASGGMPKMTPLSLKRE